MKKVKIVEDIMILTEKYRNAKREKESTGITVFNHGN